MVIRSLPVKVIVADTIHTLFYCKQVVNDCLVSI